MMMTRKQFLKSVAGAAGAAVVVGCGGDSGGGIDAPGMCTTPLTTISANHGHTLTIPFADVTAGVDKAYMLSVDPGHTHMVTITAAQFVMIKAQTAVQSNTTVTNAHMHTITVTCNN